MVSKLDLVLIGVAIACGALWIEQGHRIILDAPTHSERATPALAAAAERTVVAVTYVPTRVELASPALPAAACPDNDDVPYSASCLAFLKVASVSGTHWRADAADGAAPASAYEPK
jgi:hypothetical protein